MPIRQFKTLKKLKKYRVVGPNEIEKNKRHTNLADEFDFVMSAYKKGAIDDEMAIATLKSVHEHYFEQED